METKREKFERLAERRTNEAVKRIKLIGNLSNKNNYDYTEEHYKQIIAVLEEETRAVKTKFKLANEGSKNFKFK